MLPFRSKAQVLCPADVEPSRDDFEVIGVFNPAVVQLDDELIMLVRVAERPIERRAGLRGLPRWDSDGACVVDWIGEADLTPVDARVVQTKSDGLLRLTSVSHLRVFRKLDLSSDAWVAGPALMPEAASEEFGMEDARITKIDQTYWITYVAVSRQGAATALASSHDMLNFARHGLIFCPENKDVVLFPQRFDGQYLALHRPNPRSHFSPPHIWLARSPDLLHWGEHVCVTGGKEDWESDRIGGGAPPLLTNQGWLHLYHGSQRVETQHEVGEYAAGALLLDRTDPSRVLARSKEPILRPTAEFERDGFVPKVVFPTAMIDRDLSLEIYYGAADTCVGLAEVDKQTLLDSLEWM